MPHHSTSGAFVLVCLLLVSCEKDVPASPTASDAQPPSVSVADLEKLSTQIDSLQKRVMALESGEATVSSEKEGYDIARTKFGPFTVAVGNATPYLDGYKVTLRVGNLTNANFNGVKLNIAWGIPRLFETLNDHSFKEWAKWDRLLKKKEFAVTTTLESGAYTDIEVNLTPAKPEEIKSFKVSFELDQLELRVR